MKNRTLAKFIKYVSLGILGMLGLSCYILADTFFIANRLGSDGLASLNLAIPIYSFISGLGLMLGIGGATKYAILTAFISISRGFIAIIPLALILSFLFAMEGVWLSFLAAETFTVMLSAYYLSRLYRGEVKLVGEIYN